MTSPSNRHIPITTVTEYLKHGTKGAFQVPGDPAAVLVVDPAARTLGLRFPAAGETPDVTTLSHVQFEALLEGTTLWHVLTVVFDEDFIEVYFLLCSIADRVQLGDETFAAAVAATVENLDAVLQRRSVPTLEQQLGLIGELLVYHAIASTVGVDAAAGGWLGASGEEHDFQLGLDDLEVKTTLGERRLHWISSLTQLVPTMARPLYLVSIQLTRAGAGSGWTLPDVVDRIRALGGSAAPLDSKLKAGGYTDRVRDLLTDRWTLRTAPAFYAVTNDFPSLTPEHIAAVVPNSALLVDARYHIDVQPLIASDHFSQIGERMVEQWA